MADLTNLFDSPPAPPPRRSLPPDSPPTPRAGPSRSSPSANPLFFSPGSAIDSPRRAAPVQRRAKSPDINSRDAPPNPKDFDDDEDFSRPLANTSGQRPREISLGPAPVGDFEEILNPFAGIRNGDDDGEAAPKKRRVVAKVDPDRLTGDDGILKLMKAAKKFKVKGKGREADDLKELLNVYQLWAHGMFPKGDFVGTMTRVEVVCRTGRMKSAISGYRDAFYPRPRTTTPPPRTSRSPTPAARPRSESPSQAREASPDATAMFGGTEPLFSIRDDGGDDEEDGPDMDELMAMEEMENMGAGQESGTTTVIEKIAASGAAAGQDVPEEEDEWGGLYD